MNQSFRFVHAADLHLDSPLVGLEMFEDAPVSVIREATREALRGLVALCLKEKVAFLLIAGDVFDGEWKSLATGRFFADQMARLVKSEIPVFLIKGNHDAVSLISRDLVIPGVATFDHKRAETKVLDNLGVAIHGQSYVRRDVTENLAANYPSPVSGLFNIGMLHTCATGGGTLHAPYAPCTLDELVRKGYDYWALGHVHQRAILNQDPPIVFPGNIQGRHVREPAAEGKGVTIVEVADGSVASLTHVPLDAVRWMQISVDTTGLPGISEVYSRVGADVRQAADTCDGRYLAVRITIVGSCPASLAIHQDVASFESGLRSYVQGTSSDVWIEEIRVRTHSDSPDLSAVDQGPLADLLTYIRGSSEDARLTEASQKLAMLRDRIRSSAPELVAELELDKPDVLTSLLPEIEETILSIALGGSK